MTWGQERRTVQGAQASQKKYTLVKMFVGVVHRRSRQLTFTLTGILL